MKYRSKLDLIDDIEKEHATLVALAESIGPERYAEPGAWGDDWTIKDLFAHLHEWAQMCLGWYRQGLTGEDFPAPAEGYKWSQTPALNQVIWEKHRDASWSSVRSRFEESHLEILELAKALTEEELLTPGHFSWTHKSQLATYLAANSSSHYRAATKFIRRWLRQQAPT